MTPISTVENNNIIKNLNSSMLQSAFECVFLFLLMCFLPLLSLTLHVLGSQGNKILWSPIMLLNKQVLQLEIRVWQQWESANPQLARKNVTTSWHNV